MTTTTFVDKETKIATDWLNDTDAVVYQALGNGSDVPPTTPAEVRTNLDVNSATDLASTANGKGASLVGVEDAGGDFTATTQEGVNAEIADMLDGTLPITPDINGGTVDNAVIGGTTPAAVTGTVGTFTGGLSVSADVSGNVSRYTMTTGTATANYYSDLATISLGSLDNADIILNLLLTTGKGTSLTSVLLEVICKQTTAISATESKIKVVSLNDSTNILHNDFFLAASATTKGTGIHLWMQSIGAVEWQVQELSRHVNSDAATPISYNDAATWTATDPLTGPPAVAVTSDWAGGGRTTPTTFANSWADYGSTHPCTYELMPNGKVRLEGWVKSGTTTSNTVIFTLPTGMRPDIDMRFNGVNSGGSICTITVDSSGNVRTAVGASATYTGLDGIEFVARQ